MEAVLHFVIAFSVALIVVMVAVILFVLLLMYEYRSCAHCHHCHHCHHCQPATAHNCTATTGAIAPPYPLCLPPLPASPPPPQSSPLRRPIQPLQLLLVQKQSTHCHSFTLVSRVYDPTLPSMFALLALMLFWEYQMLIPENTIWSQIAP